MNPEQQDQPTPVVNLAPVYEPAYTPPISSQPMTTVEQSVSPTSSPSGQVVHKPVVITVFAITTIVLNSLGLVFILLAFLALMALGAAFGGSSSLDSITIAVGAGILLISIIPIVLAIMLLTSKSIRKILTLLNIFVAMMILSTILSVGIVVWSMNLGVNLASSEQYATASNPISTVLSFLPTIGYVVLLGFSFRELHKQGYTTSPYPFVARTRSNPQ